MPPRYYYAPIVAAMSIQIILILDYMENYVSSLLEYSKDGKTIIGVRDKKITSVSIPNSVTSIGNRAFCCCTNLISIVIPESVTDIGEGAFTGCLNLKSVTIGHRVSTIGKKVFADCQCLKSIDIPNTVKEIGNRAFRGCSDLTSVVIPDSVTEIGEGAFAECYNLKYVYLGHQVKRIQDLAFYLCSNLTTVVIPTSVIYIGNSVFRRNKSLTSIIIPESVAFIGAYAFFDCLSLTSVTVSSSVSSIEDGTFYNCKSLTSINIPDRVSSIGISAFENCTNLASIVIPNSVTNIFKRAFYGCSHLANVNIPNSVENIGKDAFSHINILSFIRILALQMKCRYSFGKDYSIQSHYQSFVPDGIIFRDEKPFVIIVKRNTKKDKEIVLSYELSSLQDFLGISWSVRIDNETIELRHLYGSHFSKSEDVFEIANVILSDNKFPEISLITKEKCLVEIKKLIETRMSCISQKESLSKFVDGLQINDIEIEKDGFTFTDAKETDFFMSLLSRVEKNEIWRYTSKNSLFLLLRDHHQNMLSLNCMNDISEIDYTDKYIDKKSSFLRNGINEANKVFILSCCDEEKSDDLMMWRLYAQDGEGVSLCYRIDPSKIDFQYFYLAYICYGKLGFHPELDLLKEMMKTRFWDINLHFRFRKWIVWKHFFKPYEFNYEKEIRLIYLEHVDSRAEKTMWIEDNKSGIVTPMKLFCMEQNHELYFPLLFNKVLIGPKSKEAEINRVQFLNMYNEANFSNQGLFPDFSVSKIDIYR